MTETKQMFILSLLGLILAILIFATILSNNVIRERNLKLNEHILQDCKIDQLNEVKF